MFLQALVAYAESDLKPQLEMQSFEEKAVPYFIVIDEQGKYLGIRERLKVVTQGTGQKAKTILITQKILAPKSPEIRNRGAKPLLGCDAIQYVVGPSVGAWTSVAEESKQTSQHEAFKSLIEDAAEVTADPYLKSCVAFYSDAVAVETAREDLAEKKPARGSNVALYVDPKIDSEMDALPVVSVPAARLFWGDYYKQKFSERHRKGEEGICLISGEWGPIAMTHDKVKGAARLGGIPAGVLLMSFDKTAFQSYSWKQNLNSPVSHENATAYVLALNDLMRLGRHRPGSGKDKLVHTRFDLGGVGLLYWTKQPGPDVLSVLTRPDGDLARDMLKLMFSENTESVETMDENPFYLLAVSGNVVRLVVRDWFWQGLSQTCANLKSWVEDIRIADVFNHGELSPLCNLYQLLRSLCRPTVEPEDSVNAGWLMAIVRRALMGVPLPLSLLSEALKCLRIAVGTQRLSAVRMGLIRMCVNDLIRCDGTGEKRLQQELDESQEHPAYICGRLLAVYEGVQHKAYRDRIMPISDGQGLGSGFARPIGDRYYGLASTWPKLSIPRMRRQVQSHLVKVRNNDYGAYTNLSRTIDSLMLRLGISGIPSQLTLIDQGRFAIGYHHQKARDNRAAMGVKQSKENLSTAPAAMI